MARWGNRLALRIPRDIAAKSRLTAGVGGEPATKSDDFVVRRSAPNYDLSVLLAACVPRRSRRDERWAKRCGELANRVGDHGDWEDAERLPANAAKRWGRGAASVQVAAGIFPFRIFHR